MEKIKTILSRKYHDLSTHYFLSLKGHSQFVETIILEVVNNGGEISFVFTDLTNNEVTSFINPKSGTYIIPLRKEGKMKMVINSKAAIGSYCVKKSTIIS